MISGLIETLGSQAFRESVHKLIAPLRIGVADE